jgi:hypothetical protein
VALDAGASFDPDGDQLTFAWRQISGPAVVLSAADRANVTFDAPFVPGDQLLTFEVTVDDGVAHATDAVAVRVQNVNHAPVANAGSDETRDERETVTLDGSKSTDQDGDVLTYSWTQASGPTVTLSDPHGVVPTFVAPQVSAGGVKLVFRLVVNDGVTASAPDDITITVRSVNDPPSCSAAHPSADVLWPPNHQLVPVSIDCVSHGATVTITGVTQDEATNEKGDGNASPDAVIQGSSVLLRAERSGTGDGRVYRVSFKARDHSGATCTGTVTVAVPHSRSKPAVDSGQKYDSTKK